MSLDKKWKAILDPRLLICVFLGFSSGLPLFILLTLLQAWLTKSGLSIKSLGLFALVMFPYTWKFLWAPLMDRYSFPLLGRRRGWMALTQILLFFCIGFLGWLDPVTELTMVAILTTVIAFLSSSQDIVVDAFRRELLPDEEQGLGSAIHVNAYRVSGMVPGALSLILADMMSWSGVFWVTAAFMLPGLICTLVISEPKIHGAPPKTIREAVVLPFTEFIGRLAGKAPCSFYRSFSCTSWATSLATALATKFYLDLGFTVTQIGVIAKTTGFWASLIGGLLGGIWIIGLGINRALWVFGAVQALAILGFSWMSLEGPNPMLLAAVIGFEAFGVSLGTAAFVAYIATTTDERYTATQFALFTSLAAVPRTFINASAGYIVDQTGWFMFFNLCFILALPGMMLLPKIAPWRQKRHLAQEQ